MPWTNFHDLAESDDEHEHEDISMPTGVNSSTQSKALNSDRDTKALGDHAAIKTAQGTAPIGVYNSSQSAALNSSDRDMTAHNDHAFNSEELSISGSVDKLCRPTCEYCSIELSYTALHPMCGSCSWQNTQHAASPVPDEDSRSLA